MKITFISPTNMSGGVRVVALYAQKLAARGHRVTVVSVQGHQPPMRAQLKSLLRGKGRNLRPALQPSHLDGLRDSHHHLPHSGPVTDTDLPDADVVIATWWETADWVAGLSPGKGRKFYLLQDYEMFEHLDTGRVAKTFALPLRKLAVSGYIRDIIADNHGAKDIAVIPNAVDIAQFDGPVRRKNNRLTVGFLYSPQPRKNVRLAIDVITAAKRQYPGLRVKAFAARPVLKTAQLPDWVEFRLNPQQAEIPQIYAGCDLWLFTSTHEGFGLPLLEAMACRTPVLATRAGAAPDLIDEQNGLLLDNDVASFVDQIVRFSTLPDSQWQTYSAAAYKTAHSYSWEDATDLLLRQLEAS